MFHWKPEAALLTHTLDQVLSCFSLFSFSLAKFLQRGIYTHCIYPLTIHLLMLTHSLPCTKSKSSLAPIPVGSGSDSISSIKTLCDWLGVWLVSPAQLIYLPALHAVILLSHLHNRTSYFVLVHSVPLMSSFPHHHLPQMPSPASASWLERTILSSVPSIALPYVAQT